MVYLYHASLDKIVGPLTLSLIIDLGFRTTHTELIRLDGLAQPENRTKTTRFTADWLAGRQLKVQTIANRHDKYGRWLGIVIDHNGQSLNQALLDAQLVEPYESGTVPQDENLI